MASPTDWDQPGPPTMSTGRRAWLSLSRSASRSVSVSGGAAAARAIWTGAAVRSYWTSSGTTSTTGPGRPLCATCIACATSSGMRSASSIVSTALADEPKTRW